MALILSQGRYRVAAVLMEEDGYRALKCIDLKEKCTVLANRYESAAAIKNMLPALEEAKRAGCKDMLELSSEAGAINAIFPLHKGAILSTLYGKRACPKRALAMRIAQSYMHGLLELGTLPPIFSLAASLCENVMVLEKGETANSNLILPPSLHSRKNDLLYEVSLSLKRLFPPRFASLSYELDMLDDLSENDYGVAGLYGRWMKMLEDYESIGIPYEEKVFLAKFLALLFDKWGRHKRLRVKKKMQSAAHIRDVDA